MKLTHENCQTDRQKVINWATKSLLIHVKTIEGINAFCEYSKCSKEKNGEEISRNNHCAVKLQPSNLLPAINTVKLVGWVAVINRYLFHLQREDVCTYLTRLLSHIDSICEFIIRPSFSKWFVNDNLMRLSNNKLIQRATLAR